MNAAPVNQARSKSETLSLRIDPKIKFILEFVARMRGQSITTVVERAIREAANNVCVGEGESEKNWADFWDADEGVRTLRLLADPSYPSTFEEDQKREFAKVHWQFFYTDSNAKFVRAAYVRILWPQFQDYMETWVNERRHNNWAAGDAMKEALLAAQIEPPEWPPGAPKTKLKGQIKGALSDLDDEIPF
jgi:hypothetical protein